MTAFLNLEKTMLSDIEQLIVADSPAIRTLRARIQQIAESRIPVLIEGPTGAGKELVAHALHAESGRSGELVALNVPAFAESLFESELFGHVRGAFSGALHSRAGFLRRANKGTVFLDEIGELPWAMQAKLLRAIELGRFYPVGSEIEVSADFRVVAATNVVLAQAVRTGRFREDLWYRLRGATIVVPPLKERVEDIPPLVAHFLQNLSTQSDHVHMTAAAIRRLQEYAWPGNIRELRQIVSCLLIDAKGPTISEADVERILTGFIPSSMPTTQDKRREHDRLIAVLQEHDWRVSTTAKALGINRSTLYRYIKKLGIRVPQTSKEYGFLKGEDVLPRIGATDVQWDR